VGSAVPHRKLRKISISIISESLWRNLKSGIGRVADLLLSSPRLWIFRDTGGAD